MFDDDERGCGGRISYDVNQRTVRRHRGSVADRRNLTVGSYTAVGNERWTRQWWTGRSLGRRPFILRWTISDPGAAVLSAAVNS